MGQSFHPRGFRGLRREDKEYSEGGEGEGHRLLDRELAAL